MTQRGSAGSHLASAGYHGPCLRVKGIKAQAWGSLPREVLLGSARVGAGAPLLMPFPFPALSRWAGAAGFNYSF